MIKFFPILAILAAAMPASPARAQPALEIDSFALYLPDAALRERGPSVEILADYLKAVEKAVDARLTDGGDRTPLSASLVIGIKPGRKSKLWVVAADPAITARMATFLAPAVEQVPVPAVRGYNAFAINVDLWGGDGWTSPEPLPIPEEWKKTMPDGGMLPDMPLSILMPD